MIFSDNIPKLLTYFADDKTKVLRETSLGRKRKLSNYRSKKQIKEQEMKKPKVCKDDIVLPNYEKIQQASTDEEVNINSTIESENDMNMNNSMFNTSESNLEGDQIMEKVEESVQGSSIENEEEERFSFKENCLNKLLNKEMMSKIIEQMDRHGNLYDFVNFMEQLSTGDLPADNIVLLLLLDRVRFNSCGNSVAMRYRDVTKLFWSIVYRLCKGVGIKFFGGEKNWGQVISQKCEKSKYLTNLSKLNFAVPDEKILREISSVLPKIIPPGKIRSTMNLLQGKKDIVIMADGKLVAKGLKSNFIGDVDLFGHETSPNLEDLRNYLEKQIDMICTTVENFTDCTVQDKFSLITELVDVMTEMIQKVRHFHEQEKMKLQKFCSGKYPIKPERAISACKTHIYTSSIWIRKALNINLKMFKYLANLQNNMHIFNSDSSIDLTHCSNVRLLHRAEYVCAEINKHEYPHLIHKYCDEWKELVKESLVTDLTIGSSIGLNGIKAMKKYFKYYVMDVGEDELLNQSHKIKAEKDGLATIACLFLPSLLPSCAIFYEEGCSYYPGRHHLKLLSASPSGVIR